MSATQFGDIGNVMRGCFSPDNQLYATAGGSSEGRLWSIPSADEKSKLFGHTGKLHDIVFHPLAGALPRGAPNIATASTDMDVRLWTLDLNLEFQKSLALKGHSDRVNRVVYHNTGDYLFSASFDETWIFWDLTKAKKLYRQTGHQKPIYTLSMHPDGSLILTGDTKGRAMLWDLRTGKSILPLIGHKSSILASDFSQNGFLVATGGEDNTCRIWDIRRKNCMAVLPAHTKLVTDLKFNHNSSVLMTVSHDNTMKLWHGQNFTLLKNYRAHDSKISSIAVGREVLATTTLDRKWSLWGRVERKVKMEVEDQDSGRN
jgi:U4/U6 small nuclear ribonucleoprotein PRP4